MNDISNAITILADKVGIGVDTLYQMNLSVQSIKAVSNMVTILVMCIFLTIAAFKIYHSENNIFDDDLLIKMMGFCLAAAVIVGGCLIFQFFIEETLLRVFVPDYMAMKDTIAMIGDML